MNETLELGLCNRNYWGQNIFFQPKDERTPPPKAFYEDSKVKLLILDFAMASPISYALDSCVLLELPLAFRIRQKMESFCNGQ